jgi:hypothetical protein
MTEPYIDRLNVVARFRERKQGRNILLFGRDTDADANARSNARSPFDGDLLIHGDVMVGHCSLTVEADRPFLTPCAGGCSGLHLQHARDQHVENRTSHHDDRALGQPSLHPSEYVRWNVTCDSMDSKLTRQ